MREPVWLKKTFILAIHSQLIAEFGGETGIREIERLDAAVERPKLSSNYGQTDLFSLAASYTSAIIQGHPFIDGNKRVGFTAAIVFLEINGEQFHASEVDATLTTLALASATMHEAAFAQWLKENCRKQKSTPPSQ